MRLTLSGRAVARLTLVAALCAGVPARGIAADAWTLETSARRALAVAPEERSTQAAIAARQADLVRDTAWPNPTIEVGADQKLGLEDGRGGTDITQLAITQPLPISRLSSQRRQAEAGLAAAREAGRYQALLLQEETARRFVRVQLSEAKQQLANERFEITRQYSEGRVRDGVVRYLTPLERTRLSLLHESANQASVTAEGEWREAAAQFRALLALSESDDVTTVPLTPVAPPPPLAELETAFENNPAMLAAQREVDAAQAGVEVARASRLADPTLTLFRAREDLDGRRREYNGMVLGVQVPLWNAGRGAIDRASAEVSRAAADRDARRRELMTALRESYLRLTRLIQQADRYNDTVVEPSRKFLDLTRRGFAAGEVNVLALLDANDTYFEAAQRHLEFLAEAAVAAADLRLASGESIFQEAKP